MLLQPIHMHGRLLVDMFVVALKHAQCLPPKFCFRVMPF
jgi:hypothetical protein